MLSFLFLHPWPTHVKAASSYGIMNASQSKANQKSNTCTLVKEQNQSKNSVPDYLLSLLLQK